MKDKPQLKRTLLIAAEHVGKSKVQLFNGYYARLSSQLFKIRVRIAVAHKFLRIIFKILED